MLKSKTDARCNRATEGMGAAGSVKCLDQVPNQIIHLEQVLPRSPMSCANTSQKRVRITYSQLPVSCHYCSRKECGWRWGHKPAEQMLPCPTQTTHGPATLKNCPLFFHKQQTHFKLNCLIFSNCANCSVYDFAGLVGSKQAVCLASFCRVSLFLRSTLTAAGEHSFSHISPRAVIFCAKHHKQGDNFQPTRAQLKRPSAWHCHHATHIGDTSKETKDIVADT